MEKKPVAPVPLAVGPPDLVLPVPPEKTEAELAVQKAREDAHDAACHAACQLDLDE